MLVLGVLLFIASATVAQPAPFFLPRTGVTSKTTLRDSNGPSFCIDDDKTAASWCATATAGWWNTLGLDTWLSIQLDGESGTPSVKFVDVYNHARTVGWTAEQYGYPSQFPFEVWVGDAYGTMTDQCGPRITSTVCTSPRIAFAHCCNPCATLKTMHIP